MQIVHFLFLALYFLGIGFCFIQLTWRLETKKPSLKWDWHVKSSIIVLSLFSWVGLFIVLTSDLND